MNDLKELQDRMIYLGQQIEVKKLAVERALAELESIVKQYLEIEDKLKQNEIPNSSV